MNWRTQNSQFKYQQQQSYQKPINQQDQQNIQTFIPQQQNPFHLQNQQKSNISNSVKQHNPEYYKGPQFLFDQEQAKVNQPIVQQLLYKDQRLKQQSQINDQILMKTNNQEEVDDEDEENDQDQEEVNQDEEEENQDDEEEDDDQQTEEENDDDEDDKTVDENENENQAQNQIQKINNTYDKYKSLDEIDQIRDVVGNINKELDQLDQEIGSTLIMSRVQYESENILDLSIISDMNYSQYLKEFEQFKQQKQCQTFK